MEEQDVKTPEEQDIQPQEQEDVNDGSENIQQDETVDTQPQVTPPEVGQPSVDEEVDEMGVPWKNRAMEYKRKFEQTQKEQDEKFQQILEQVQQGGQKQKYTAAQLRAFANDPNTPANERMWAEQEIDKLQKQELGKVVEEKLTSYQKKQQADLMRQQALRTVQQRHPEAFVKNAQGQVVGWNEKSPLTRKIGQYLQDPEIKNNPRGLMVATALANWDLSGQSTVQSNKLKQEVRNLQKKTLVEGGGKAQPVEKSPVRKALDRAKQGNGRKLDDAQAAMKEMLRAKGLITDE